MNVVGVQFDIQWEDKPANVKRVRSVIEQAHPERGSLVVLPEMFATGFSMNTAAIAEEHGGQTEGFLSELAKEYGVYLIGGASVRSGDKKVRNKALLHSPAGDLVGFYAKMRPFSPGGESDHYTPGDKPMAFDCAGATVAPFVCYDLRFPELFRQITAMRRP